MQALTLQKTTAELSFTINDPKIGCGIISV